MEGASQFRLSVPDSQVTSTVTSMVMSTVVNLQCNYLSQYCNLILHHIGPARVEGKMEQSVGCTEWLILPCCATHRTKWNGQPWQNYPAGNYKKEGKAECHTGTPPAKWYPLTDFNNLTKRNWSQLILIHREREQCFCSSHWSMKSALCVRICRY